MIQNSNNPLSVLGLEEGASEKDIRRAYARLAKDNRPDVDPEGFTRIRAAYESALKGVHVNSQSTIKPLTAMKTSLAAPTSKLDALQHRSPVINIPDDTDSTNDHAAESVNDAEQVETFEDVERVEDVDDVERVEALNDAEQAETTDDAENFETLDEVEQAGKSDTEPGSRSVVEPKPDKVAPNQTERAVEPQQKPLDEQSALYESEPAHTRIGADASHIKAHELNEKVNKKIAHIERLLAHQDNHDQHIETELVDETNKLLKLVDREYMGFREGLAEKLGKLILQTPSVPFGFVEIIVKELDLDGRVQVSSDYWWKSRLQRRYENMPRVIVFEEEAGKRGTFAHRFVHGGPIPFRFSGYPSKKDLKQIWEAREWLVSLDPPRNDLIHPDSAKLANKQEEIELAAILEDTDARQQKVDTASVDAANTVKMVLRVCVFIAIAFSIGYILLGPGSFESPGEKLRREATEDPEVAARVEAGRHNIMKAKYPNFPNILSFDYDSIFRIEIAIGTENVGLLEQDLPQEGLSNLIPAQSWKLKHWLSMVQAGVDFDTRTDATVIDGLFELTKQHPHPDGSFRIVLTVQGFDIQNQNGEVVGEYSNAASSILPRETSQ